MSALSEAGQLLEWRSLLAALDAAGASYHRFYSVLMPLWDRGDVPAMIEAESQHAFAAEAAEDARWEAQHFDHQVAQTDPELAQLLTCGVKPVDSGFRDRTLRSRSGAAPRMC